MSLKQINTRAKSIRKAKPGMTWHAAQKAAAAALRGTRAPARKKRAVTHHTTAVSKTRKRSVGSTHVVVTRKKKRAKKGWFGSTASTVNRASEIIQMGAGIAVGAAATNMVLRPLEHKAVQMVSDPKLQGYLAKAMPWVEMFLGGTLYIVSGNKHIRNIGVGVMGAGVSGVVKQLPIHMHSPAETINGVGSYTSVRIPINGTIRDRIAGLIQQPGYTHTPTVGESIIRNSNAAVHTPTVGAYNNVMFTPTVGEYHDDDEDEILFRSNHFIR